MHILKDVIYSLLVNYLPEDSTFEAADSCQSHWHEPSDCEPDLSAEVLRDKTNPVEKKKLSYWLYSTTERIWSTNRSFIIFCPKRTFFQGRGHILNIAEVPFAKHPASRHLPFHITLVFMSWLLSMSSFWSLLQDARSPAQERNGTMLVDRRRLFLKRNIRTETTKTVKTSQESFVQGYRSVTIVNITVSNQLRYRLQFQISNWMVEGRLSTYC